MSVYLISDNNNKNNLKTNTMKTLALNTTVKLENLNELLNMQDCLRFICGTINGSHFWNDSKMNTLSDLQVKLQNLKEKKDGSFVFRLTLEQRQNLNICMIDSRHSVFRCLNDDIINTFEKLFK